MADVLLCVGLFLCGSILTIVGLHFLGAYVRKKYGEQIPQQSAPSTSANQVPNASVIEKLREASEIAKEQSDIQAAHSMPSKNASHSVYKNQLAARYKELEDKKNELLRSIVKDGFDPIVMGFNPETQQDEQMPLSHFLNMKPEEAGQVEETPPPENVAPETITKVVKKGRTFYLIEGGKTTTH